MSAPQDRLLTDAAAERLELEALSVMGAPLSFPAMESLAAGVLALVRDRQARVELAVSAEKGKAA